jgi:hypothetical protein
MPKQILFSDEGRAALLRGVNIMAAAVKATMGPKGRNVVIDKKFGSPTITKDCVMVAKEIELKDNYKDMGAQMIKEVASKTSDIAGDGTTTATVLAHGTSSPAGRAAQCGPCRQRQGPYCVVRGEVRDSGPDAGGRASRSVSVATTAAGMPFLRGVVYFQERVSP